MKAFTLVELIVVIAIIGLLAILIVPVANKAIETGKKANEIAAIKNLVAAYNLYSADNNNLLLKSYDMNGTAIDNNGRVLEGEDVHEAHRWPWRLAPYFNYDFYHASHVNDAANYIKKKGGISQTYLVSVIPSFGLNVYLGGNDYELRSTQHVATYINQIIKSVPTFAFISSRSSAANEKFEGFYYVDIPKLRGRYDPSSSPRSTGYISARYSGSAVVAYLNGAASVLNYSELLNTNNWYPY